MALQNPFMGKYGQYPRKKLSREQAYVRQTRQSMQLEGLVTQEKVLSWGLKDKSESVGAVSAGPEK